MFKRKQPQEGFVYTAPMPACLETREIEKACVRLFSTQDGQKVLGYLQAVTFARALGINASDEQLRYMEGQRALVGSILRLMERGRA